MQAGVTVLDVAYIGECGVWEHMPGPGLYPAWVFFGSSYQCREPYRKYLEGFVV